MYILVHQTPADNLHIYQAHNVQSLWQQIKDEIYADPADAEDFEELRELHYNEKEWEDYNPFFGTFKVQELKETPQELRGILLSVTVEDLEFGNHLVESELEFVTQEMLDEIADTMWHDDPQGWKSKYDKHLGATLADNWQYWQDMIKEEKERRANEK